MGTDRRKHVRSLKELEFTCYIDGQQFKARSLDISRGGALMETGELVPLGSVALIAMTKGTEPEDDYQQRRPSRRQEFPIVLLGLVVRHQTTPITGLGLQWLRCVSRVGLGPLFDFLGFVMDLFPSSLPLPPNSVIALDFIEYDFVLEEFRPGRKKAASPNRPAAQPLTPDPEPKPKPVSESGPEVVPDLDTPAIEATPHQSSDAGELIRLVEGSRELIYRPTNVEVISGKTRSRGVVHSLGQNHLLLATPGKKVAFGRQLSVKIPVPVKGKKIFLDLHCDVSAANPMEGRDAVAWDLAIRSIEGEPTPGLWKRWVQFLLERKSFLG